jgi:hypothetical protein
MCKPAGDQSSIEENLRRIPARLLELPAQFEESALIGDLLQGSEIARDKA